MSRIYFPPGWTFNQCAAARIFFPKGWTFNQCAAWLRERSLLYVMQFQFKPFQAVIIL